MVMAIHNQVLQPFIIIIILEVLALFFAHYRTSQKDGPLIRIDFSHAAHRYAPQRHRVRPHVCKLLKVPTYLVTHYIPQSSSSPPHCKHIPK